MRLSFLLDQNIQEFGEYPFLYYGEKKFTNVETRAYANQLAIELQRSGIKKGDRVIVMMPNSPEVLIAYQAITRAQAVIVPVLFTLHPKEIAYIAENCEAARILSSSSIQGQVNQIEKELSTNIPIVMIDDLSDLTSPSVRVEENDGMHVPDFNDDEVAVILYTSGTTGSPKGVMLTHRNLYKNAVNSSSHANVERGTTIGALPLAHVFGLTISHACYVTGSSIVIFPRFIPSEIFSAIERYQVKSFSVVPAMIYAMMASNDAERFDLTSLESVSSGSAPLPVSLLQAFEKKFGASVYEGYGLSEASPIVTAHKKGIPIKPGSVGIPIPGVELKVVDATGQEVPRGVIGEIVLRGEHITPGYFQNERESEKAIVQGWLHTGDIGQMDDEGYLYIVDRKKDLIIKNGFNIYPRDLEEVLSRHKAVIETAVIGVPDEQSGEEVMACVVKKPNEEVTEEELIAYCAEQIAKNKLPKHIVFLSELPRNGVGKVLKASLRKSIAEGKV